MSWVDVDVIAKPQNIVGGVEDRRLKHFQTELERQHARSRYSKSAGTRVLVKNVTNVYEMATQILAKIGNRRIRRLRVFGHGSPNLVQMGPFQYTGRGVSALSPVTSVNQHDLGKVIQAVRMRGGNYELLNKGSLEKLKGHFQPGGWVELQSCRAIGLSGEGKRMIEGLADLWNVAVQASDAKQIVGGGFEGNVWQAKPGKKAVKIREQAKSSLFTLTPQIRMAENDPVKKALDSLKSTGTTGTRTPVSAHSTSQASVFSYKPTKVGSFSGQNQYSSTKKVVLQRMVRPTQIDPNTQINPAHAGYSGYRSPSSTMPKGTTYSNIYTGNSFRVNDQGKHLLTGTHFGTQKRTTFAHNPNPVSQNVRTSADPLQDAFNSLKPKYDATAQFSPGTTYSNLYTRKSYIVDNYGRHNQIGSLQSYANNFGANSSAQNAQAWQNPLRAAAQKLGG